jgi:flagellar biosynthesis chaperone FliJ
MKAFRYRLTALLSRAEHREQVLQMELARRQEELAEVDRQLASARTVQRELQARVRDAFRATRDPHASVDLGPLRSLQQALDDVDELEGYMTGVRRCVAEQIAETRERLLEAARSRQVLEKHRQQLAERHRWAARAAETKQLDELAGRGRSSEEAKRRGVGEEAVEG